MAGTTASFDPDFDFLDDAQDTLCALEDEVLHDVRVAVEDLLEQARTNAHELAADIFLELDRLQGLKARVEELNEAIEQLEAELHMPGSIASQ